MQKWSKMTWSDKGWAGLGVGIAASVIGSLIHEFIWPSPETPETEEDRQKDKELKRLKGKILRRARFRCENCGQGRRDLEIYYIDEEGECTYDNLRALCSCCENS